jgi:hypothetical protein
MRIRSRDLGAFNTNIELMIRIVIVSILLAIAVPAWLNWSAGRSRRCLENLAKAASAPLPAGTSCPVSGKPYGASCPAPEGHLDSAPKLIRTGSAWRLEQTLPAGSGDWELGDGVVEASETPSELKLRLHARTPLRKVLAVVFFAGLGIGALACTVLAIMEFRHKESPAPALIAALICLPFLGGLAWWWGSGQTYVIAKGSGRLLKQVTLFDRVRSESAVEGCIGVVPVRAPSWLERRLVLVHADGKGGLALTDFEEVPAGRTDLADRIQRALVR